MWARECGRSRVTCRSPLRGECPDPGVLPTWDKFSSTRTRTTISLSMGTYARRWSLDPSVRVHAWELHKSSKRLYSPSYMQPLIAAVLAFHLMLEVTLENRTSHFLMADYTSRVHRLGQEELLFKQVCCIRHLWSIVICASPYRDRFVAERDGRQKPTFRTAQIYIITVYSWSIWTRELPPPSPSFSPFSHVLAVPTRGAGETERRRIAAAWSQCWRKLALRKPDFKPDVKPAFKPAKKFISTRRCDGASLMQRSYFSEGKCVCTFEKEMNVGLDSRLESGSPENSRNWNTDLTYWELPVNKQEITMSERERVTFGPSYSSNLRRN